MSPYSAAVLSGPQDVKKNPSSGKWECNTVYRQILLTDVLQKHPFIELTLYKFSKNLILSKEYTWSV